MGEFSLLEIKQKKFYKQYLSTSAKLHAVD
jgi:hypothetical protein